MLLWCFWRFSLGQWLFWGPRWLSGTHSRLGLACRRFGSGVLSARLDVALL